MNKLPENPKDILNWMLAQNITDSYLEELQDYIQWELWDRQMALDIERDISLFNDQGDINE